MALGPLLLFFLNVLSAVVALLTSYYAYRSDKLADSPLLKALALGFMLLGVGLLIEALTSVVIGHTLVESLASRILGVRVVATFVYLLVDMAAYLIFALGYGYLAFGRSGPKAIGVAVAAAVVGVPRIIDFAGEYRFAALAYFVMLILLAFVVFQGVLIHGRTGSRFSLLVLLAFVLILVAHVVLLLSVIYLAGGLFLVGTAVQFLGFVSLLVFLLRSGRVGPA